MYVLLYNKTWLELWNRSIASLQCSDVNCGKYSEFTLCTCKCQYLHMYDSVHFCKWISLVELSPYIFFHTQIRYITKESVFYFLFTWQITWKLVPWQMSTLAALSFVTINKTFIKPNILNWCWLLTKKKKKKVKELPSENWIVFACLDDISQVQIFYKALHEAWNQFIFPERKLLKLLCCFILKLL